MTTVTKGNDTTDCTVVLSPEHLAQLRASGITDEIIQARGYRTISDSQTGELRDLGFSPAQRRPGLLIPIWSTDGRVITHQLRPDSPRIDENKSKKNPDGTHPCRPIKYETPKNTGLHLDCPPACLERLADPHIPLWITEGSKKADALAARGLVAISLPGVWGYKGKNEFGGVTVLADWDHVALNGRDVRVVFDSDVMTKNGVQMALERLTEYQQRKGATVSAVYLPNDPQNGKVGVDDWLAAGHTVEELEHLITEPRPALKAAPATLELLDVIPARMTRPLCLLDGISYAATWLLAKKVEREGVNKSGEIVRYDPPRETMQNVLVIVRGDGAVFCDGLAGARPMSDLALDIHLPEIPRPEKVWSKRGFDAYIQGIRPDPIDVFNRITDDVDRFIDFDRSLGEQRTMAELVACYVLATYFLDAFDVIGFLWPNGYKGSGKTNLLHVIAEQAYLGHVILASASFAALRDMADYGATLAFDDAENTNDPKTDPDKRALLLAGNRRGATIALKELNGDKSWKTRYVDAYCPRLFSAIKLPDSVLASRTIVIPLVRSTDRTKTNLDPLDLTAWPHDRRQLVDDLWALGLEYLPKMREYDREIGELADLQGRALQPWRAILAVAKWLQDCGVEHLAERIEALSLAYQGERSNLEWGDDITPLVMRALAETVARRVAKGETDPFFLLTGVVAETAREIARDDELDIENLDTVLTNSKVGRRLAGLRLTRARQNGTGSKGYQVTAGQISALVEAHGIPLSEQAKQTLAALHHSTTTTTIDGSGVNLELEGEL